MACKKCDPHEICEECPEWIFTLADLIMCMMGLFVLLWVLKESGAKASTPQQAQQMEQEWMHGFQQGFQGYIPTEADQNKQMLRTLKGPGERGVTNQEQQSPDGTENQSSTIRPGREVTTGGRLLFSKGEAELTPALKRSLDSIAGLIRGHRQIVQIKGHASRDDLVNGGGDGAAMDLSMRRAQAVFKYLVTQGVEPEVLRLQACGLYEPVKGGDSRADAQSTNRRVEVFATDTLVDDLQDRGVTAAPLSAQDDEPAARPAAKRAAPTGEHGAGHH